MNSLACLAVYLIPKALQQTGTNKLKLHWCCGLLLTCPDPDHVSGRKHIQETPKKTPMACQNATDQPLQASNMSLAMNR